MLILLAVCALACVTVLAAEPQTITITATATDATGGASAAQTVLTVTHRPDASTLADAKSLADTETVHVTGLLATSSSSDFAGMFYVQQADRSGGIGILWDGVVQRGEHISVTGSLTTLRGERFIQAQVVDRVPEPPK